RYRGREAGPVKPVSFSPEDGASVPRLNFTTNPVIVTFNAALAPGETPDIRLVQLKDGVEEFLYALNASVSDRQVMIYPVTEQRLAEGTDYRIDFGAGSVTDLSGDGPNEAFSITYHGNYVPEIDPTSNTIFSEDFSTGLVGMLLYDGDKNIPTDEMKSLDFVVNDVVYPWIPTRDEEDVNFAAASHSCYDPAGKSDDWMVTPQLYIPDDQAKLTFKSQNYRADKNDVLKVYVWESDDVVTILTQSIVDKIRYDGDLVYNEVQKPGASEENLIDDWRLNSVDLSKYAGKYVYIAFVNDNRNQSIVFVDDILVSREVVALISVDTDKTLVGEDETEIRGRFVVMKESGIEGYSITLADAEGNVLGSVSSDEALRYGEMSSFSFSDPVALEVGEVNPFVITFTSGDETIVLNHNIRDLLFDTTKRIVLEEMTGTGCQFCPQGIIGIEYLQDLFGDIFIPIAIHSYTSDMFGGALDKAYSSFLGHSAAPQGTICRGLVSSPMYYDKNDYLFTAPDGMTWLQQAEEALAEMTHVDIDILSADIDEDARKVSVETVVKSAINLSGAGINVFGVIMEDGLIGLQNNGLFNTSAPGLGEWGKGGAYATSSNVLWTFDDVLRGTSAIESNGIYSGFNGKGGYVPSVVKAGEEVNFTFDFNLPSNIKDINKTKVCLMLIDANTGEYINAAASVAVPAGVDAIGAGDSRVADVYDLSGRLVLRAASAAELNSLDKGIYIRGGKKFVVR
ncbi:MAG: choice-of-anchor J domain-containing protein, partial [Muribaculaceae bacterium]|nr:choice-of-anchor J domain-containing protein [Muribaculaceae bacterium]